MGRSIFCLFWDWNHLCLITLWSSPIHLLHCLSWQLNKVSSLGCLFQAENPFVFNHSLYRNWYATFVIFVILLSVFSSFIVSLLRWLRPKWYSTFSHTSLLFCFVLIWQCFSVLFLTLFLVIPSYAVYFTDCCWALSWWSVPYFLSSQQVVQSLSLNMYRYDWFLPFPWVYMYECDFLSGGLWMLSRL